MSNRIFPIQTETACRLKWAWSTLYLNSGATSSCHRSSHSELDVNNFANFHNTANKIAARQTMLAGQWPAGGCEYCKDIEQAGGVSDRIFQNQIPDVYPQELDQDINQVHVAPSILEVFFSNTCNLKCVYCEASLSSAIQAEDQKFGGSLFNTTKLPSTNQYQHFKPLFWSWFEHNYHTLQRLQVLGGEPLLQKDLLTLLDFFDNHACPNLEFNIVSNLSVPSPMVEKISTKLMDLVTAKKLKRVDIQASVDCWGPGQEYVRTGFDRELFDRNMSILISKRIFRIGLLSTVCSLTIPEMPQLVVKHQEWSRQQEIFWYMHLILPADSVLDPAIFGSDHLVNVLEQVYNSLPNMTWDQQQTQNLLSGIIKKVKANRTENLPKLLDLKNYLNAIDLRRGLNWQTTFPWLATEIDHVVQ